MTGKTIFITYKFDGAPYSANTNYGFASSIHCAYVSKLETDTLDNRQINVFFSSASDFPFMVGKDNINSQNGWGWSATGLTAIVQIVDEISDSETTITPSPTEWRTIDLTNQIPNHSIGDAINPSGLTSGIFIIDKATYDIAPTYNLEYLEYPTKIQSDRLTWGEESWFFGNIETDIKSIAYTTDIVVELPLGEFNSTTNETWTEGDDIYVSEIAMYDEDGDLVAIGKINNPLSKNNQKFRTIIFEIDF
ncbi:MAG: hypothetical protein ACOCVF_01420 [bacterium]